MKIIPIFDDRLFSFWYENEDLDEFSRLMEYWDDPLDLEQFFYENQSDLKTYYKLTVNDAVKITMADAENLEANLKALSRVDGPSLDKMFQPLAPGFQGTELFERSKIKGTGKGKWLRIYALKIEGGVYCVTGGAIKLTRLMNERPHTDKEWTKIHQCLKYLQAEHIVDEAGFFELANE